VGRPRTPQLNRDLDKPIKVNFKAPNLSDLLEKNPNLTYEGAKKIFDDFYMLNPRPKP